MLVYKVEWSQYLGSHGPATRIIEECCEYHADLIFRSHPNAHGAGKYEAKSCSICEREGR